jgi:hypothetical protein
LEVRWIILASMIVVFKTSQTVLQIHISSFEYSEEGLKCISWKKKAFHLTLPSNVLGCFYILPCLYSFVSNVAFRHFCCGVLTKSVVSSCCQTIHMQTERSGITSKFCLPIAGSVEIVLLCGTPRCFHRLYCYPPGPAKSRLNL